MTAKQIAEMCNGRRSGRGYKGHCPAHEDRHESLSISTGLDRRVLLHCHAGCEVESIIAALGLKMADLFTSKDTQPHPGLQPQANFYDYCNAEGTLLYQTCRFPGKQFRQRRPDGKIGWEWSLEGVERVLYHLPQVLEANVVCIAEGEKDAETLAALHLERYPMFRGRSIAATTNSGGAGKWKDADGQLFKGKDVLVFEDNDDAGSKHALDVLRSVHPYASSVRLISLPGLQTKGDVSDWMQNHSANDLLGEIQRTPLWHPEPFEMGSAANVESRSPSTMEKKADILTVAFENIESYPTVRQSFRALCVVLQRLRGDEPAVLPIQRIAEGFNCQHTLISRLRIQGVAEGWLKPVGRAIAHRKARSFYVLSDTPSFRHSVIEDSSQPRIPSPSHSSDTPQAKPFSDTPLSPRSDTPANERTAGGYVEGEL